MTHFAEVDKTLIQIDGAWNFRDVFWNTKLEGKIFRSSLLSKLSYEGLEQLKKYHIDYFIDLRTKGEIKRDGRDLIPSNANAVTYEKLEFARPTVTPKGFSGDPDQMLHSLEDHHSKASFGDSIMFDIYNRFITDPVKREMFADTINLILEGLENNEKSLFHCTAGKDRTGWVAYILQSYAGIPYQRILDEFLYSSLFADRLASEMKSHSKADEIVKSTVLSTKEMYLQKGIDEVKKHYNNFDNYLEDCGVNLSSLKNLKNLV